MAASCPTPTPPLPISTRSAEPLPGFAFAFTSPFAFGAVLQDFAAAFVLTTLGVDITMLPNKSVCGILLVMWVPLLKIRWSSLADIGLRWITLDFLGSCWIADPAKPNAIQQLDRRSNVIHWQSIHWISLDCVRSRWMSDPMRSNELQRHPTETNDSRGRPNVTYKTKTTTPAQQAGEFPTPRKLELMHSN
jgi:hypothetical protein